MADYDAIVLGVGGVGSATLYQLARRGAKALGLERYQVAHDRGSSHGHTRIIRQAYFEHPDYVPLLRESYRLWHELEAQIGYPLCNLCGLLEVGPAEGVVVPGVIRAARDHQLAIEVLTPSEIESRWPVLRVPSDLQGVYEKSAGYLLVEACVEAHCHEAARLGAELATDCEVRAWRDAGGWIELESSRGVDRAEKLVVCAGAWSAALVATWQLPLRVLRKSMFWYADADARHGPESCPAFLFELPDYVMYGLPAIDDRGVKLAEHSGGNPVDDPALLDRNCRSDERREIESFAATHLPNLTRTLTHHATCMYTLSPDEHFMVDFHPLTNRAVICAGLSGHGFKFTPVLGQVLADLTLTGASELPVGMFGLNRFSEPM